jgi:hypothetical protein
MGYARSARAHVDMTVFCLRHLQRSHERRMNAPAGIESRGLVGFTIKQHEGEFTVYGFAEYFAQPGI